MRAKKSVKQIAEKWQISERQVRDFCENGRIKGYLKDTCLTAQDRFKTYLDYFEIPY